MRGKDVTDAAKGIMTAFAERTGLAPPSAHPTRYLWTDAFAVCNFLDIFLRTGDDKFREHGIRLVDQVHHVLGRYREDDPRTGWISGLDEAEGKRHPTRGGLRIGKQMKERGPDEPSDDRLEWERDGEYFHYLSKWMHALDRAGQVTGESAFIEWAIELAKAAHAGFTYATAPGGQKRMHWKMSTDLSRPLVAQMGQHDPLDGWITYLELEIRSVSKVPGASHLSAEIADMADMCRGLSLYTEDPLGIGELLTAAYRVARIIFNRSGTPIDVAVRLLEAGSEGLEAFLGTGQMHLQAEQRLPFRELGLSIGIHAVKKLSRLIEKKRHAHPDLGPLKEKVERLLVYAHLAEAMERFWMEKGNRKFTTWTDHLNINSVMLATSLSPDGYLGFD